MDLRSLAITNLKRRAGRTVGLVVLVALLALSMFGGTLAVSSLRSGLNSLEDRLGADLIVAPDAAKSTTDLEAIMRSGTPGNFYMNRSILDKVREREGVEQASPQYYLATAKASCCASRVQIIGFEPETDFSIQPWIARSYQKELGLGDIIVGCNISGSVGTTAMFYGKDCTIVAKLDKTGTSFDQAVFCNADTIKWLIAATEEQGMSVLAEQSPDDVISTVQVKVVDGVDVDDVVGDIKLHVRGATAVRTTQMISGVSDSMSGVSRVIGALVAVVWVLAAVVLVVVFTILGKQRTREFAVLRVAGASRSMLSRVVMLEALITSVIGAVVGIVVGVVVMVAFSQALENALGVPFLLPSMGQFVLLAVIAAVVSVVVGCAASVLSARRLSKVDTGQILREG